MITTTYPSDYIVLDIETEGDNSLEHNPTHWNNKRNGCRCTANRAGALRVQAVCW